MTAYDADTSTSHNLPLRFVALLALVGGTAWTIDTVSIAVLNRAFDPLDSFLFFTGLACLVLTAVALAVHVSAGRTGPNRIRHAAGAFLATVVALGAIALAADAIGRRLFAPTNIGLHDEWSCFSAGVCLLAISAWAFARTRMSHASGSQ